MLKPASLFLLLISVQPLLAAETCPQQKAIYAGSDGYGLAFQQGTDSASAAPRFELSHGNDRFTGFLMESDAPTRTVLHVEKDCPEGDLTGADIAACTAYEGYAYALSADGNAANLPSGGEKAAARILLSGLGPTLAASPLAQKLNLPAPASDLFTFKACAS